MTRLIHLDWAEACGFSLLAFLACFIMFFQHSTTMHSVFEPLSECPIHSFDEHQIEINTILFPCTHGSNFPDTSPVSQDSAVLRLTSKAGTASWRKGSRTRFLTRRERLTGRTRRPGTWSGNRSWGCQPQLERCFQGMNWLMLGTLFLKVVLVSWPCLKSQGHSQWQHRQVAERWIWQPWKDDHCNWPGGVV